MRGEAGVGTGADARAEAESSGVCTAFIAVKGTIGSTSVRASEAHPQVGESRTGVGRGRKTLSQGRPVLNRVSADGVSLENGTDVWLALRAIHSSGCIPWKTERERSKMGCQNLRPICSKPPD
jgi:hypothetical protein